MTATTFRLRVPRKLLKKVEALSKATKRTPSNLAAEALGAYVDEELAFVAAVEEGIRSADAGDLIPHSEVVRWVKSWGTKRELPKPVSAKRRA